MEKIHSVVQKVGDRRKAFFCSDSAESFYLTSFRSTFGIALVTGGGELFFFTDGRYIERAEREVKGFKVLKWEGWEKFADFLKEAGIEVLIVDPERLKLSTVRKLSSFSLEEKPGFLSEFRSVNGRFHFYAAPAGKLNLFPLLL